MRIKEFMGMADNVKVQFTQYTYPCGRNNGFEDVWTYDMGVFENVQCEDCGKENVKGYGTSDYREPKWCADCFIKISEDTDFVAGKLA